MRTQDFRGTAPEAPGNRPSGLDKAAIARVRREPASAWSLPPAAYLDPEIYALEIERIFRRGWTCVAHRSQVASAGDYIAAQVLDQPVLITHGGDGRIRALSNVCLHRNAVLAEGCGHRRLFTCPYHAWSYDETGRLVAAPLMEGAGEISGQLPELPVWIWMDFIFVGMDPAAPPPRPDLTGLEQKLGAARLQDLSLVGSLPFTHGWNWKVLVENFMEAYHHIGPHGRSLEPAFPAALSRCEAGEAWVLLEMPGPEQAATGGAGTEVLYALFIEPGFMLAIYEGGGAWYQMTPTGPHSLDLVIHTLAARPLVEAAGAEAVADAAGAQVRHIHEEDIAVNDRVWAGLCAPLAMQGRLGPLEETLWRLNQWWLDRLGL